MPDTGSLQLGPPKNALLCPLLHHAGLVPPLQQRCPERCTAVALHVNVDDAIKGPCRPCQPLPACQSCSQPCGTSVRSRADCMRPLPCSHAQGVPLSKSHRERSLTRTLHQTNAPLLPHPHAMGMPVPFHVGRIHRDLPATVKLIGQPSFQSEPVTCCKCPCQGVPAEESGLGAREPDAQQPCSVHRGVRRRLP